MTSSSRPGSRLSQDELSEHLVRTAQNMVPTLRERADRTDGLRRLLPETEKEFAEAGFFGILQRRPGDGLELDVPTLLRVGTILGSGCPSSAWVQCLFAVHNWAVGLWPAAARREVFDATHDVRVSMVLRPEGTAEAVPGGFRLTGTWAFATGIDVATHVAVAAMGRPADSKGSKPLLALIVPAAAMEAVDDWFVLGLRGTGSKSVRCEDLFVPTHMVRDIRQYGEGSHADQYAGSLRAPLFTLSLIPPVLGALDLAIDAFRRAVLSSRSAWGEAENAPSRIRWSRAHGLRDAASVFFTHSVKRFSNHVARRAEITHEFNCTLRLQCAEVMRMCVEAVDLLMSGATAGAYYDRSPLQRAFRDIHMAQGHGAMNLDDAGRNYARTWLEGATFRAPPSDDTGPGVAVGAPDARHA